MDEACGSTASTTRRRTPTWSARFSAPASRIDELVAALPRRAGRRRVPRRRCDRRATRRTRSGWTGADRGSGWWHRGRPRPARRRRGGQRRTNLRRLPGPTAFLEVPAPRLRRRPRPGGHGWLARGEVSDRGHDCRRVPDRRASSPRSSSPAPSASCRSSSPRACTMPSATPMRRRGSSSTACSTCSSRRDAALAGDGADAVAEVLDGATQPASSSRPCPAWSDDEAARRAAACSGRSAAAASPTRSTSWPRSVCSTGGRA